MTVALAMFAAKPCVESQISTTVKGASILTDPDSFEWRSLSDTYTDKRCKRGEMLGLAAPDTRHELLKRGHNGSKGFL